MARYNQWQNISLYGAADSLSDDARRLDRGAFFGSIHDTLSHLAWADQQWMSRFAPQLVGKPTGATNGPGLYPGWAELVSLRTDLDKKILDWATALDGQWLTGSLTWYSGLAKAERTKPRVLLVAHFFNHQTHHRGQVHAMLTAAGVKPDDTDLMLLE
jgi:uncharacterized damage-inducible protein DinB